MTELEVCNAPVDAAIAEPHKPQYKWEDDALTFELVLEMQRNVVVETRAFIKPIFKWMKTGVRKSGQRNEEAVEKAFAFVAWMQQLSCTGDVALRIPAQPQLDASYALNTIITSAQRADSHHEAERAFEMLKAFGYTPDVFAFTALIDVLARSRDVTSAFQRYEEMRASSSSGISRPNLVVFLTVIRAIGFTTELPVVLCLTLLDDARRDGVFDNSLYVRTIELCAKRRDGHVATQILQQMAARNVDWNGQLPILRALQRVLQRVGDADAVLRRWRELELVAEQDVQAIKLATSMMQTLYASGSKALGCARHVSESARHGVMRHAIDRLVERLANGASLSTSEFETLIHQCRKRKRKDDVGVILDAMREIASVGWTLGVHKEQETVAVDDNDAEEEEKTLVVAMAVGPQPQLTPNSATYAAVVETFLACGDETGAWRAFLETTADPAFVRSQLLYRKFIRGCCLLMDTTHIVELLQFAKRDGVVFTTRMKCDIASMHGRGDHHTQGIDVILHQLPVAIPVHETHVLLQTLAASCAASQNTTGVQAVIQTIVDQGLQRTGETDLAVLQCSLYCETVEQAITLLRDFQTRQLLLDTPVYSSLIREIFFKCMRGVSKPSSRVVETNSPHRPALKMLYMRRAFIDTISELQHEIERDVTQQREANESTYYDNTAAIQYWTSPQRADHAPMLFLQHVMEATATITDKRHRDATIQAIQRAVLSTRDPLDFILHAVCALPVVGLPFRSQGKLAKQLLALVLATEIQPHHVGYCLEELPNLNVYIVKELDDALHLVDGAYYAGDALNRVMAFCIANLETPGSSNNSEKIIAFLLSRPALQADPSGADHELFGVLARRFVVENDTLVLQYFKAKAGSTATTQDCITFIRLVVALENNTTGGSSVRCSVRAIVELKLEHEAEFLPLLLHCCEPMGPAMSTVVSTASGTKFLTLPLPSSRVVLVDDADSLEFAYEVLLYEGNVTRLAIDAEWRPTQTSSTTTRSSTFTRCAVLQLACDSHVFLIDLTVVEIDDLVDLLGGVLSNQEILKLGFRLDGDLQRLRRSFPDLAEPLDSMTTVRDLADCQLTGTATTTTTTNRVGLSALVERVLGYPLDKTQQCSDWEQRPLSKEQIQYAALDAYCLLMLHDAIQDVDDGPK